MDSRVRWGALFVLLAGAAVSAGQNPPSGAPAQGPTFKVNVDYVEVDAIITDKQGQFVRDLKKEDFQVFEDGKPQSVVSFGLVDIPVEKADKLLYASTPVEPDMKTNERPFDGRIYVMVIDDLHTNFARTSRVKAAGKRFIQRNLGSNDLMAVVHTSGTRDGNQEFTNNRRLLMAAVDKAVGQKLPSPTVNRAQEFERTRGTPDEGEAINDPDDAERAFKAMNSLQTLKAVADWFAGVRGRRKSILFLSEGIDYDVSTVFNQNPEANNQASSVIDATRAVIASAAKGNVSIYGIDPRGLTNLGDESIAIDTFPTALPDENFSQGQLNALGIGTSSLMNEVRIDQDSLRTLSDETGGFAVVNQNQPSDAFDKIVVDNSSYYVMAYYPPNPKPGAYHKIEVKVKRPDLTVRSRRGYTLPKSNVVNPNRPAAAGALSTVLDALDSPLPVSGLTLRVFAAPFKGTAPNASVLLGVEMRGRDLKPSAHDVLQVSYRIIDTTGKVRAGNTDSVTLNLRPETLARVNASGLRMLKRVDLPPGRYQVHVAANDTGGGKVGSVTYDLEVPDFNKDLLDISGIAMTSQSASVQVTAKPDEMLQDVLPAPPAGIRTFVPADDLALFAEIYDGAGDKTHTVAISTSVLSDTGQVMFKTDESRSSSDLGGKRGGYGYIAKVPLKDLAEGAYVLRVEAKSSLGSGPTVSREVPFRVEPARLVAPQ